MLYYSQHYNKIGGNRVGELVSIYGLIDPRDESCFYVGRAYTRRLGRRLNEHVAEAKREGPNSRKRKRILAILETGDRPGIETLEEVDEAVWGEAERRKMAEYREFCELTNIAPGGQGPTNWNEIFTQAWDGNPERKRLIGQQTRERWKDPDYREAVTGAIKARYDDPEYRQRISELQQRIWADNEEGKAKISEAQLENWQDPDYRERVTRSNVEAWSDPDRLAAHAERTTELWQDPEYREKVVAAISDSEAQARRRESMAETWDEDKRAEQSEKMAELWQDPDFRARQAEGMAQAADHISEAMKRYFSDPEARRRLSEQAKERMADPERREHLSEKVAALWDDPEYREQQHRARNRGKLRPDVEKAAEALGVKVVTIYKYCHQGKIGTKVGSSWVITDEEIEAFRASK